MQLNPQPPSCLVSLHQKRPGLRRTHELLFWLSAIVGRWKRLSKNCTELVYQDKHTRLMDAAADSATD